MPNSQPPTASRLPDRARLAHQNQERGLEGVVGVVRVAQELPADAQDHRPVAVHQRGEGGLGRRRVRPGQKPFQELAIGQGPGRAEVIERRELTAQVGARSCTLP